MHILYPVMGRSTLELVPRTASTIAAPILPRAPRRQGRWSWRGFARKQLVWIVLAAATQGCNGCNDAPKVPFKLGEVLDAGSSADNAPRATESHSYHATIDEPILDGQKVPIAFVRALLSYDLDGDGDRDALAVTHDAALRLRLLTSLRDGNVFTEAHDVPGFRAPGNDTCATERASLHTLGKDKGVVSVVQRCGDMGTQQPASHTIVSLENPVRVYERFELQLHHAPPGIVITTKSADADEDEHADVVLEIRDDDAQGPALELIWLDRASGLARDTREPDATLSAWAGKAQAQLAKHPEQALALAERVIRFDRAVCREAGAPALMVSGVPGVPCASRKGVASALTTAALAHAKMKHVRAAFTALSGLQQTGAALAGRSYERLLAALSALADPKSVTLREGPRVEAAQAPRVRLPSARFIDDNTLLVRRREPVLYDLQNHVESAALVPADDLVRDPAGALCVSDVEETACGLQLRIERAPPPGTPYVRSAALSTPPLTQLGPGLPCTNRTRVRAKSSGFQVLGWAPQGVVLNQGAQLWVVPLDLSGSPLGAPFVLPRDVPPPAPLPSGVANSDGSRYIELTPVGVLVSERAYADTPVLWRPDGYSSLAERVQEAAVSPAGTRVAVIADDVVYVLTRVSDPH